MDELPCRLALEELVLRLQSEKAKEDFEFKVEKNALSYYMLNLKYRQGRTEAANKAYETVKKVYDKTIGNDG